jgi:hypothetical protein
MIFGLEARTELTLLIWPPHPVDALPHGPCHRQYSHALTSSRRRNVEGGMMSVFHNIENCIDK